MCHCFITLTMLNICRFTIQYRCKLVCNFLNSHHNWQLILKNTSTKTQVEKWLHYNSNQLSMMYAYSTNTLVFIHWSQLQHCCISVCVYNKPTNAHVSIHCISTVTTTLVTALCIGACLLAWECIVTLIDICYEDKMYYAY